MYRQHVPLPAYFTCLYAHALQFENVGGHALKVGLSQAAVMPQRRIYARSNGSQTSAIAMSGRLAAMEQQEDNFVCSNKIVRRALQRLRPQMLHNQRQRFLLVPRFDASKVDVDVQNMVKQIILQLTAAPSRLRVRYRAM